MAVHRSRYGSGEKPDHDGELSAMVVTYGKLWVWRWPTARSWVSSHGVLFFFFKNKKL
jgi:hypothetical protein